MTETHRGLGRQSEPELRQLLDLLDQADSVELKLTVPDGDQRSAVVALEMDPLDAEIRQVYFLDTPRPVARPARRDRPGPAYPCAVTTRW